jgi:hypothetical protein
MKGYSRWFESLLTRDTMTVHAPQAPSPQPSFVPLSCTGHTVKKRTNKFTFLFKLLQF